MKDKSLEEQFNGYFEGVNAPDKKICEDAKKQVKKRPAFWTSFAKYASIAASIVLVCVIGVVVALRSDFFRADNAADAPFDGEATAPDPSGLLYDEDYFTLTEADAYTLSKIHSSLKFLENLAYSDNATVSAEVATFNDGETLAHVSAQVALVTGTRYDATVYVELSDYCFSDLWEYREGESGSYRGVSYLLTQKISENGEPEFMLYAQYDGVKYYFDVTSSDPDSYKKCLELILN